MSKTARISDAPTRASTEDARNRYKPKTTNVLFIGESPPSGGTFFYFGDSKLFQHVQLAFREALPDLVGDDFLGSFQRLGCYLDDLCLRPVNHLKKGGAAEKQQLRQERREGEKQLAERIKRARPRAIILIGIGIADNVRRAVAQAESADIPFYVLPFPNWHRDVVRFDGGLYDALKELAEQGVLA